jgi:hypothetical protein
LATPTEIPQAGSGSMKGCSDPVLKPNKLRMR